MDLRTLLVAFLVGVLYPVWLLAGAADYMCHRRTDITHTSGATEAWLQAAQLLCIGAILLLAVTLEVTALTWSAMLGAAVPVLEELLRTLRARGSGRRPEPTFARLAATLQR